LGLVLHNTYSDLALFLPLCEIIEISILLKFITFQKNFKILGAAF